MTGGVAGMAYGLPYRVVVVHQMFEGIIVAGLKVIDPVGLRASAVPAVFRR